MYTSKYKPIPGFPLTETIPLLLEWRGVSPIRVEEQTDGKIKQASIHRICSGATKDPKRPVVQAIADFFGLSFAQIYDVSAVKSIVNGPVSITVQNPLDEPSIKATVEVMKRLSVEDRQWMASIAETLEEKRKTQ